MASGDALRADVYAGAAEPRRLLSKQGRGVWNSVRRRKITHVLLQLLFLRSFSFVELRKTHGVADFNSDFSDLHLTWPLDSTLVAYCRYFHFTGCQPLLRGFREVAIPLLPFWCSSAGVTDVSLPWNTLFFRRPCSKGLACLNHGLGMQGAPLLTAELGGGQRGHHAPHAVKKKAA